MCDRSIAISAGVPWRRSHASGVYPHGYLRAPRYLEPRSHAGECSLACTRDDLFSNSATAAHCAMDRTVEAAEVRSLAGEEEGLHQRLRQRLECVSSPN